MFSLRLRLMTDIKIAIFFFQTMTPEDGQTLFSLQSMPQKIQINSNDIGSVSVMNKLIADNFQVWTGSDRSSCHYLAYQLRLLYFNILDGFQPVI